MDMEEEPVIATSKRSIQDVLAALTEVIEANQSSAQHHQVTPTEYFALIVATLRGGGELDHLNEMLQILSAVLPQSNVAVVRSQFKLLSEVLIHIIKEYNESTKTLKYALCSLGALMCVQEGSDGFWSQVFAMKTINIFLRHFDDSRLAIRKAAHTQLASVLSHHKRHGGKAMRNYVAEYCREVLKTCERNNYKKSLYVVQFLEQALALFLDGDILKLYDMLLHLQECEVPVLTAAIFRMLDACFQNYQLSLPNHSCVECIHKLLQDSRRIVDMEAKSFHCTALTSAMIYLFKCDRNTCMELLPAVTQSLIVCCQSEFTQIHCAVGASLKRIISTCIDSTLLASVARTSHLPPFLNSLIEILAVRFQNCWPFVLDAIRALFERLRGKDAHELLAEYIEKISDLYHAIMAGFLTVSPPVEVSVRDTLSVVLRSLGVELFLAHIPFYRPNEKGVVDSSYDWILTMLHNTLKHVPCSIKDFDSCILSIIQKYIAQLQTTKNITRVENIHYKINQLWALFPLFCHHVNCSEAAASLERTSLYLNEALRDTDHPDKLPNIISGLTQLCLHIRQLYPVSGNNYEVPVVSQYTKSLLPTLLTHMESLDVSENRFHAGVQCVAALAGISSSQLVANVSKKLLQLLLVNSSQHNHTAAAGYMSILLTLIPYQPEQMINLIYRAVKPLLSASEDVSMQKRAYNVLQALLSSHVETLHKTESRLEILNIISNSLLICHVGARHIRLRCVETLISHMSTEELNSACSCVLGEVLICLKDANKKCRDAAFNLLKVIIYHIEPEVLLPQIYSGIVAETPSMRSATITALCVLMHEKRDNTALVDSIAPLFNTLVLLLQEENVEESRAVLSYIRIYVAVYSKDIVTQQLGVIITAITQYIGSLKSKFASRIRAIVRKLDQRIPDEILRPMIPSSDISLLDYIQKQARRKLKHKEAALESMMGSDSEGEESEEEMEVATAQSRVKAVRASDVVMDVPTTLDDLLEDQPAATEIREAKTRAEKALQHNQEVDEDEPYSVQVTADGRVVIAERNIDTSAAAATTKSAVPEREDKSKVSNSSIAGKKRMREPGEEYRSKKAGGDVWKKGMMEPHAYIPLDPHMLSKKNTNKAVSHYGVVIKKPSSTGQQKGTTMNRKQRIAKMKHKMLKK